MRQVRCVVCARDLRWATWATCDTSTGHGSWRCVCHRTHTWTRVCHVRVLVRTTRTVSTSRPLDPVSGPRHPCHPTQTPDRDGVGKKFINPKTVFVPLANQSRVSGTVHSGTHSSAFSLSGPPKTKVPWKPTPWYHLSRSPTPTPTRSKNLVGTERLGNFVLQRKTGLVHLRLETFQVQVKRRFDVPPSCLRTKEHRSDQNDGKPTSYPERLR